MIQHTKTLLRLYWAPAAAMSDLLDRGSLLFASLAVLALSLLLRWQYLYGGTPFYAPLLILAAVYVPGTLLLARLLGPGTGTTGALFQRDYSPLLTCAAMAWTAANLPFLLVAWLLPFSWRPAFAGLCLLYFLVFMFFAVRTVFGAENRVAFALAALSWIPLVLGVYLLGPLQYLLGWLASPFFLFYAYYYLGSEIGSLGSGLRSRQHFRRTLEIAALNPHDGEAQYQLGLVYQHRRQYTEAIQRFRNAVAIDPANTDAHFQLGCIARRQGRLHDALEHFQAVVDQDENHSQGEILRELGAVYLAARQYEDARRELSTYVGRHPYDPEGLFYLGQALEGLDRLPQAREVYANAIEAARTAPRYLRSTFARWSRLAQRQLRKTGP